MRIEALLKSVSRYAIPVVGALLALLSFTAGLNTRQAQRSDRVLLAAIAPLPDNVSSRTISDPDDPTASLPPVETYHRVLTTIQDSYYGPSGLGTGMDDTKLTYCAIRGMLASLGDKYTRFLEPDEYRRMQEENQGEFGGIGARLEKAKNKVFVKEVLKGTPAAHAGLVAGDVIQAVDGVPLSGMSIYKAVDLIRGETGTRVKLTILRRGQQKPFVVSIRRALIEPDIVQAEMLPGGIAHIRLTTFNQRADTELDHALTNMERKKMQALILDLRDNPGGLLSEAVAVASRFVKGGPVVIIQERGGARKEYAVQPSKHNHKPVPLVVLVNKWSASASEIVAGAIKDTGAGLIVGTETWGKGLVQTITPIPTDGSAVLITTHRYYTPNGTDINHRGIQPDVRVELTDKDLETQNDRQLREAVAILSGRKFGTPAVQAKAAPK